jgi:selenocysteine-specific elongation factor
MPSVNVNIGILGHVDSGKTSLVKALSTSLSTAALDKHPQSQQRGITLDLGFSSFSLPLPDHLLPEYQNIYDVVQFTLVDCPGHASLIKTIIGGAQIIDMIILVIDANKGIQTQTAECIVIGEMTTDNLIIVLNKIDSLPEDDREDRLEKVTKRIRMSLSSTKFRDAPIVRTAAFIGGEKVAAVLSSSSETEAPASFSSSFLPTTTTITTTTSIGIDTLTNLLKSTVTIPHRDTSAPFYFAIDHCFAIKGHGTVLTGTILSGKITTNTTLELPYIQQQRKVKSMQMFRKPVKEALQGDRVGICVTNLDSTNIERGIAAAPDSIPLLSSVICMVKKVRYFRGALKSNAKFHISIGHTTIIATATFYGAKEMQQMLRMNKMANHERNEKMNCQTLNASYHGNFPSVPYDWDAHFEMQDVLYGGESENISASDNETTTSNSQQHQQRVQYGNEPVQWALLQFQQSVYCPMGSLIIGSRLDMETKTVKKGASSEHTNKSTTIGGSATTVADESSSSCRLAFHGPIVHNFNNGDMNKILLYSWKEKEAEIFKLTDVRTGGLCFELIAHQLYSEGASITPFVGMRLLTASNHIGVITGTYGSGGKFKVKFLVGVPRSKVALGTKLILRFKRFVHDKAKVMKQFDRDFDHIKVDDTVRYSDGGEGGTANNNKSEPPHPPVKRAAKDVLNEPSKQQTEKIDPPAPALKSSRVVEREGVIDTLKEEGHLAIVSGMFGMEENIKSYIGAKASGPQGQKGELLGPYAKLGKCKVRFEENMQQSAAGGGRVILFLKIDTF